MIRACSKIPKGNAENHPAGRQPPQLKQQVVFSVAACSMLNRYIEKHKEP